MSKTIAEIIWDLKEGTDCRQAFPAIINEMNYMYRILTTTNEQCVINVKNGKTFSFRAECQHDIDSLRSNLFSERQMFTLDDTPYPLMVDGKEIAVPDVIANLVIDMTLEQVRQVMRKQADAHVMIQTLRECSIFENSFERDYSAGF